MEDMTPEYECSSYVSEDDSFKMVLGKTFHDWEVTGYTPIFLWRLVQRGHSYETIDRTFERLIGKDYAHIKITEWCERLNAQGIEFDEEMPFIDVLEALIFMGKCDA